MDHNQENKTIIDIIPDILVIIHLDDKFLQGRINIISNLTDSTLYTFEDILKQSSYFEKTNLDSDVKIVFEGMESLITLIRKVRSKIKNYLNQNKDIKIFLLNFINSTDSKKLYKPYDNTIIEIENFILCEDNNIEQTKSLITKLFQMGLLPNKRLRMELIGVYRHACVININRHLNRFIGEENLLIENWINEDFTI